LIGLGSNETILHVIDFGLYRKYKDDQHGRHVPHSRDNPFIGTTRYASVNAHDGIQLSRRDDMESLGFVLIYLYKGSLPWQGLGIKNISEKHKKFVSMKSFRSDELKTFLQDSPECFMKFIMDCQMLSFMDTPNYAKLRFWLDQTLQTYGLPKDEKYDWVSSSDTTGFGQQAVAPRLIPASLSHSNVTTYSSSTSRSSSSVSTTSRHASRSGSFRSVKSRTPSFIQSRVHLPPGLCWDYYNKFACEHAQHDKIPLLHVTPADGYTMDQICKRIKEEIPCLDYFAKGPQGERQCSKVGQDGQCLRSHESHVYKKFFPQVKQCSNFYTCCSWAEPNQPLCNDCAYEANESINRQEHQRFGLRSLNRDPDQIPTDIRRGYTYLNAPNAISRLQAVADLKETASTSSSSSSAASSISNLTSGSKSQRQMTTTTSVPETASVTMHEMSTTVDQSTLSTTVRATVSITNSHDQSTQDSSSSSESSSSSVAAMSSSGSQVSSCSFGSQPVSNATPIHLSGGWYDDSKIPPIQCTKCNGSGANCQRGGKLFKALCRDRRLSTKEKKEWSKNLHGDKTSIVDADNPNLRICFACTAQYEDQRPDFRFLGYIDNNAKDNYYQLFVLRHSQAKNTSIPSISYSQKAARGFTVDEPLDRPDTRRKFKTSKWKEKKGDKGGAGGKKK